MNKLTIIGNLTNDPDLRTTTTGVNVCSFNIAVNRRHKVEGQPDARFLSGNCLARTRRIVREVPFERSESMRYRPGFGSYLYGERWNDPRTNGGNG